MSDETKKKVGLITGGNKGIGLETARQLGKLGITVLIGARDLAKGEAAVAELKKDGVDARAVKLDVDNAADYEAVKKLIEKDYGVLDILINNAGIMIDGRKGNETTKTSQDILRKTFNTNFFAVVGLTQTLLPLLKKSLGGRIVNLSSILGSNTLHATPGSFIYDAKTFAYDASKSALNSFTIHLAHELKDTKIKVNSAHRGGLRRIWAARARSLMWRRARRLQWNWRRCRIAGPTVRIFIWVSRCPGRKRLSFEPPLAIETAKGHAGKAYLMRMPRGFTFSRMKSMVDSSGVPGPKMAETPLSFNLGWSSSGMVPPRTRRMSSAFCSRRSWVMRGTMTLWAPERMERPMQSTSSWMAAETIISGVWRRPV